METFICCLCGKETTGWGNNPSPVVDKEGAKCCNYCNNRIVIPTRILGLTQMLKDKKGEE